MSPTRFLVFTDLHADIMHDAVARMQRISTAALEAGVDFVVQLGDLMYPDRAFLERQDTGRKSIACMQKKKPWSMNRDDEKLSILQLLSGIGKPVYSVIGNHDLHVCDKTAVCRYWNMPAPYYAFCEKGFRFLVLDTNLIWDHGCTIDMAFGNHSGYDEEYLRYLSEDQRIWLDRELTGSDEPCIVLSHVSLADPVSGIHEREKVLSVLGRHRDRVRLVMNGHGHVDGLRYEAGIPFWDVNSASYHFTGAKYACTRYSEKLCAAYPKLSGTAPYYDPLYAIVELLDDRIRIHGTHSVFVGPTPQELGLPETENDYEPCAEIRDREILFG